MSPNVRAIHNSLVNSCEFFSAITKECRFIYISLSTSLSLSLPLYFVSSTRIQALESDNTSYKRYWVFRSWGRIGTTIGGTKLEQFTSSSQAIAQFSFLYEEKTGNSWLNRKNFVKYARKFMPVDIDYGNDDEQAMEMMKAGGSGVDSRLEKSVQNLVQFIFHHQSVRTTDFFL